MRPKLLYVTAVTPAGRGNGLAMRAGMVLDALREGYQASVLTPGASIDPGAKFDIVHVFRAAALAAAKPYLESAGRRHLDLDDIDSKTHRRIAEIYRVNGLLQDAAREQAESRRCELVEIAAFRKFHRVYVCSEADRAELMPRCPTELLVLPNAVRLPKSVPPPPRRDAGEPFQFLFVGTMGYYPNLDAYLWFLREVLPILQFTAPEPFQVNIAGTGSDSIPQREQPTGALGHVRILGPVPDVAPVYTAADAVVVPLRAGGGTRIKILEAFSYRRPVISTSIGAEGIASTPGRDILLADTAEDFAARCVDLMRDRDLGARLAANALKLVSDAYSEEALKRIVSSLPAALTQ